jgi:hypothetical protein
VPRSSSPKIVSMYAVPPSVMAMLKSAVTSSAGQIRRR